ncbi:hypothetical protein P7C71_g1869, partial [Lecanoromycetidae sp. Uapishka_2]
MISSEGSGPFSQFSDDFENFPPAVKRKYFSSLERLRLAQGAASKNTASSLKSPYGSVKVAKSGSKPSRPALARRNSSYFKNPSILRRKTPSSSPTTATFSHLEAQWFLRLPEKVQRRHFTPEEREFLSGHQGSVAPDAADEKLYKFYRLSREANRSVPTLRTSSYSSLSSISTFDAEQPLDSASDMDQSMIWFDDNDDLDLALDDYHQFINKAAESNAKCRKRGPSFRRALSLTSLPFGANLSSSPYPPSTPPPVPAIPQEQQKTQAGSHSRRQSRAPTVSNGPRGSISAIEPSARHYQDPEARLKLRVYLASPQKFDEAIEFGFPSMDDKENMPLSRPSLSRNHKTAPCKTFLYDDQPSLIDALDDDEDSNGDTTSLPERHAPFTSMDNAFHNGVLLSPSIATSSGSSHTVFAPQTSPRQHHEPFPQISPQTSPRQQYAAPKPLIRHDSHEPFAQLLAGSREMTLRMTLTRPDLRADEKALYAHTTGDDPLALEHLPPTTKEADIWDSMPKDRGIMKKLWRKVSGKS